MCKQNREFVVSFVLKIKASRVFVTFGTILTLLLNCGLRILQQLTDCLSQN